MAGISADWTIGRTLLFYEFYEGISSAKGYTSKECNLDASFHFSRNRLLKDEQDEYSE